MLRYIFKPKGSRVYRGRYRIGNSPRIHDVSLHTDKKHVALGKLTKLVAEQEAESEGWLATKSMRDSAQKPLLQHLQDYEADLKGQGRSRKHIAVACNRTRRLFRQCGWGKISDATSDGFNGWRARQNMAAKTCNDYLGLASAFFNWMERNERIAANPLRRVAKTETKGKECRKRRALSLEEIGSLVANSGKRGLAYFLAAFTGLRRGEIKQLMCADVHLDVSRPFIEVRASTTKNKKTALIPLVPALADALRAHLATRAPAFPRVFRNGVPTAKTLRRDLKACGIAYSDELGRIVDFHALRHTFGSMLACAGIAPRIAMELMRHSDMRLTQTTYTDVALLPLFNALEKLPCPPASLIASQNSALSGQKRGNPVQSDAQRTRAKIVVIGDQRTNLAKAVPTWENVGMAERVGFEPTVPCGTPDFESGTIDHSVTSPKPSAELAKTARQMKAEKPAALRSRDGSPADSTVVRSYPGGRRKLTGPGGPPCELRVLGGRQRGALGS